MPTLSTINSEGAFDADVRNAVNANFSALNSNLTTQTPTAANAAGVAGSIRYDASYIYVCVSANTWKRAAIATW